MGYSGNRNSLRTETKRFCDDKRAYSPWFYAGIGFCATTFIGGVCGLVYGLNMRRKRKEREKRNEIFYSSSKLIT